MMRKSARAPMGIENDPDLQEKVTDISNREGDNGKSVDHQLKMQNILELSNHAFLYFYRIHTTGFKIISRPWVLIVGQIRRPAEKNTW